MSKKGRTSIVLLGSLVLALICVPLAFLAYGAKLDRDALNNRIADLEATEIANPTALQADCRSVIEKIETAKRGWPSTNVFTGATYPTFGALHSGGLPD